MPEPKLHIPENFTIRPYQHAAYEEWVANGYTGIFAMATGTGKTITSLNCIYQEYLKVRTDQQDFYRILILVPTQPLLLQWCSEVAAWGAKEIYKVNSGTNWRRNLQELVTDLQFGISPDFAIVATYRSFTNSNFLEILRKLPKDLILIADEAHNIGQSQVVKTLAELKQFKRIGLSATPKRIYDPEGTVELEKFFNDQEPYTFSLYMDEAIASESLCKYDYFPRLVELTPKELTKYTELSLRIAKLANSSDEQHRSLIERLLLLRKNIINKAQNKLQVLAGIIKEIEAKQPLSYCFAYAPAGDVEETDEPANAETKRFIRQMQRVIENEIPGTRTHAYLGETQDREEILNSFANGEIDVLLAINCLDEGVDVPRTEIGIFTSSTGNPRQFIQRRGRLLRKHPAKSRAIIYDMIVVPQIFEDDTDITNYRIERALVRNELMRVGYFAKLSENFYEAKDVLEAPCTYYNLNLDTIIKELEQ